jgi:hypothetical protein
VVGGEFDPVEVVANQAYRVAVQIVVNDLQLAPDECVVKRPIEDAIDTESGVVTDTPGSQGWFALRGCFAVSELHTRFPFGHFFTSDKKTKEKDRRI